jgi:histidinol-phosphate/aromatic aminotransferase/cobyric acid decarboxylase-like protein
VASTSDAAADPLRDHGDRQVPAGALDLAVNVLADTPAWLRAELGGVDLTRYPDPTAGVDAAAARHGVPPEQCLLVNGAAEAFWAVAHGLRPRLAACVHPSFTAPEAALRSAGVEVHRVLRRPEDGFALDPALVPDDADLVVLGHPDNPTGRQEPVDVVRQLARPGRVLVVDEAFADFLPDAASVASLGLPGVLAVRSLTKLWGLAGLRVGYALGPEPLLRRLAAALQPWPVSSLAVHAVARLSGAEAERAARAGAVAQARAELVAGLRALAWPGLRVWASPANFVLVRTAEPGLRERLLDAGIAVRRGDTFPGLDARYVRIAVPLDPAARDQLLTALRHLAGVRA